MTVLSSPLHQVRITQQQKILSPLSLGKKDLCNIQYLRTNRSKPPQNLGIAKPVALNTETMSCTFFFDVCVPSSVTWWSSTIQSISPGSGINWPSKRGRSSMLRVQFSNRLRKRTLMSAVVSSERLRNVPSCNWSIMAKYKWGSIWSENNFFIQQTLSKRLLKLQG